MSARRMAYVISIGAMRGCGINGTASGDLRLCVCVFV